MFKYSIAIRKFLITIIPFITGMLIMIIIKFPINKVSLNTSNSSIFSVFIANAIICLIILYVKPIWATIVYCGNLFFMGMIMYITLSTTNNVIYCATILKLFIFIYTYVYAREKDKKKQSIIVFIFSLILAIIESCI